MIYSMGFLKLYTIKIHFQLASLFLDVNGVILSTDDFFITPRGSYSFVGRLLPEAHDWNKERAKQNMKQGEFWFMYYII